MPILFATSEGLHLRLLDENFGGFSEHKNVLEQSLGSKSQWTVEPTFVTELCDLTPQLAGSPSRKPSNLETIKENVVHDPPPQIVVENSSFGTQDSEVNSDELLLLPPGHKKKRKVKFNSNIQEIVGTPNKHPLGRSPSKKRKSRKKSPNKNHSRSPSNRNARHKTKANHGNLTS